MSCFELLPQRGMSPDETVNNAAQLYIHKCLTPIEPAGARVHRTRSSRHVKGSVNSYYLRRHQVDRSWRKTLASSRMISGRSAERLLRRAALTILHAVTQIATQQVITVKAAVEAVTMRGSESKAVLSALRRTTVGRHAPGSAAARR